MDPEDLNKRGDNLARLAPEKIVAKLHLFVLSLG
jgi:hypothetical protein